MKENFRRPHYSAVRSAIGFVAGVVIVQQWPALPPAWGLGLLGIAIWVAVRRRWIWVAACLCGVVWAAGYGAWRLDDRLEASGGRRQAFVEGRVLGLPEAMEHGVRFDFAITRVIEPAGGRLPSKIRLSWYDDIQPVKAGERWRFRVSLRPPRGMMNPGGFDYEAWLFAEGIRAVGYVRNVRDNRRLGDAEGISPQVWRQAIHDRLDAALAGGPVAGLIMALTMGAEEGITAPQWDVLRRTGTAHLIAISGSHIGLIAALAFFLTRRLCAVLGGLRWSPPRVAAAAGFVAALLYSALAGFAIPTQRAMIMIAVAMGAILLQRNLLAPHVLAVAMLAVLIHDPLAVLSPGFWLSFAAVALIALGVSGRLWPAQGWRALVRINWVTALGLAPLLLLFFRQVSLVSPLANLLAVPVLGTLLIPVCLLGALLLPVLPPAGEWLLRMAEAILIQVWPVLEWLSALPGAQWTHAEPPFWAILLALTGVLLGLAPRGIPARWLALVLIMPAVLYAPERPAAGAFRLTLLDVGQGLAAVVETRTKVLVFDTGARLSPAFDMGSAVIEPYLRHRGVGHIDTLVVSHGDNDHIGGARSLLAAFPVVAAYSSVSDGLGGMPVVPCADGQRWEWDGVRFEMLGPTMRSEQENDNSCVLKVSAQAGSVLLTGDIERDGEQGLIERHGDSLHSEVLVAPHHGSKTSSTPAFLSWVSPRIALIPAGFLNRYGFPDSSVVERYRQMHAEVLTTGAAGAITVAVGPGSARIKPASYRQDQRRYWFDQ